jgi:ABC-type phosphate transport system permease subunit
MPALGICAQGLTRPYGYTIGNSLQLMIFMMLIGCCGASIISAFIYRFATATDNLDWFKRRTIWVIMLSLHLFLGLPSVVAGLILNNYYGITKSGYLYMLQVDIYIS